MGLWNWIQRRYASRNDPLPEHADVIIAIGVGISPDGLGPSVQSARVAERAAQLFTEGRAPFLLFTGNAAFCPSYRDMRLIESRLMAKHCFGTSDTPGILRDTQSGDTVEKAQRSRDLLCERGWRSAIIVTHEHLARRARWTFRRYFRKAGIRMAVIGVPAPYGGNIQLHWKSFPAWVCWDVLSWMYGAGMFLLKRRA